MLKTKNAFTAFIIAIVLLLVVVFMIKIVFCFFGNPFDRNNVKNIAQRYLAENYSEMNPAIVNIDYDAKYIGYQVEVHLEKTGKTFWLKYYESGELEWDSYNFSEYEIKYAEAYYEEGLFGIWEKIGTPQNEKQKAVIAVINFDYEIQNGGLAQYLINEDDEYIKKIVHYLRTVGAQEQATLLETFMTENGIEFKSVETNGIEEHIEFEKSKPFDEFNDAYMKIYTPDEAWKPDFEALIVSYIQENIEDF